MLFVIFFLFLISFLDFVSYWFMLLYLLCYVLNVWYFFLMFCVNFLSLSRKNNSKGIVIGSNSFVERYVKKLCCNSLMFS